MQRFVSLLLTDREIELILDLLYNETQLNERGMAVTARRLHDKIEGSL